VNHKQPTSSENPSQVPQPTSSENPSQVPRYMNPMIPMMPRYPPAMIPPNKLPNYPQIIMSAMMMPQKMMSQMMPQLMSHMMSHMMHSAISSMMHPPMDPLKARQPTMPENVYEQKHYKKFKNL